MAKPRHARQAYNSALQLEHLVFRILDEITATHRQEAAELADYSNQMMGCLRRSNGCIGTKRGQRDSIQAAVWMVELLIILTDLNGTCSERAHITAAIELLERIEEALRVEGLLPPARG